MWPAPLFRPQLLGSCGVCASVTHKWVHAAVCNAAAILRQLPVQHAKVSLAKLWNVHSAVAALLASLLCELPSSREAERRPLLRQAGQVALATLPAMAAAAAAMSAAAASIDWQPHGAAAATAHSGAGEQRTRAIIINQTLFFFTRYQQIVPTSANAPPPGTDGELLDWVAAADAMLRLLPVPAELAAELAALPPAQPLSEPQESAAQLARCCVSAFGQTACMAGPFVLGLDGAALQAVADEALPSLAALHSRACCLVHWSQAGGPARSALVGGALPGGWPALTDRLVLDFSSARILLHAKCLALGKEVQLDSPLGGDMR